MTVKEYGCHNIIFQLQQLNFVFHLYIASINVQLKVTMWHSKILAVDKSKETRGDTALRDIGLTVEWREKLFWNKAEVLEIIQQFLWNIGGINTNPERTSLEKEG